MEKLSIRNFGPIRELELEIKKFTILVGEQSTGKSTVAKIVSIFKDAIVVLGFIDLSSKLRHFGLANYFQENTLIKYESDEYDIECRSLKDCKIIPKSQNLIEALEKTRQISDFFATSGVASTSLAHETLNNQGINTSVYIPAERILISSITASPFEYLNSEIQLPEYLASFGKIFQDTRKEINDFSVDWLGVKYSYSKSENWISYKRKKIRMSESATGFQNVIPLLMAFERPSKIDKSSISYSIEEPELSLFPQTQYLLIKHLVEKCHALSTSLLITTHSPYVLSAFNNLIYANKAGKVNSKKTEKIIAKKYWIDSSNVTAVFLNEKGKADNILDNDIDQIDVEKIDQISRAINLEYDELFNIENK